LVKKDDGLHDDLQTNKATDDLAGFVSLTAQMTPRQLVHFEAGYTVAMYPINY